MKEFFLIALDWAAKASKVLGFAADAGQKIMSVFTD